MKLFLGHVSCYAISEKSPIGRILCSKSGRVVKERMYTNTLKYLYSQWISNIFGYTSVRCICILPLPASLLSALRIMHNIRAVGEDRKSTPTRVIRIGKPDENGKHVVSLCNSSFAFVHRLDMPTLLGYFSVNLHHARAQLTRPSAPFCLYASPSRT